MAPTRFYTVDAHHPQLNTIIGGVLKVQSQLVATREQARADKGFLISRFTPPEMHGLFINRDARLVVCEGADGDIQGYTLTTHVSEFTDLYKDGSGGRLDVTRDLDFSKFRYLYQIAVSPRSPRRGIGSALLARVKSETPGGLITDVLKSPVANQASIQFFLRHGFRREGLLTLGAYRSFGELQSEVYSWAK